MAACPRAEIVHQGEVEVFDVWTRCLRRAFLCGNDPLTGRDYEYRRQWIHGFQQQLAGLFGVEIGFHAELSNHLHLVLRARPDVVVTWSDEEVVVPVYFAVRMLRWPPISVTPSYFFSFLASSILLAPS